MIPSPFFKNAFLFHGAHILLGSRCHELLTAKKLKETEARDLALSKTTLP